VSSLSQLRLQVIERDRQCVAFALDLRHDQCRDTYGTPHSSTDLTKLTLEHVKLRGRRIDDQWHCIALCGEANVRDHWGDANNAEANAYLLGCRAGAGAL
jgi:hypothetical protein